MGNSTTGGSYLDLRGVVYHYPNSGGPALDGISLSIGRGEFVCILGPSGCGKSTLLAIVSGLATPQAGRVEIDGHLLCEDGQRVSRGPRCGYVFQDHRLLPWKSVKRNITLALAAAGVPQNQWAGIVRSNLELLHLGDLGDVWPMKLSGGQRQRAAIARALAIRPSFLLMDEPFSTLDEVTGRILRKELLRIWRTEQAQQTVIFVTHSVREAVYLADRIYIMSKGPARVLEDRTIHVPRPRAYEDVRLAEIEGEIIETALREWGYDEEAGGEEPGREDYSDNSDLARQGGHVMNLEQR